MREWMAVIANNIEYSLNHQEDLLMSGEPRSGVTEIHIFEQNPRCADCGAASPTWCCINWGTCICIKCSGVHRALTTVVSRVRSLTLDRLDTYAVRLLGEIGNERANAALEKHVEQKIEESAERSEREFFINQKYVKCAFVDIHEIVDLESAIKRASLPDVYKGICQRRKLGTWDPGLLRLAAAYGEP
jgi:hypothetical protein